jgi:rod shape-determining protein MreD
MNQLVQNIIRFGIIVFIQIFLLNDVEIIKYTTPNNPNMSLFRPFFYLLFILMLPANISRYFTLIICFVVGITIDTFTNKYGLHTSTCLVLGLVRPTVLNIFFQTNVQDMRKLVTPSLVKMGFRNFLIYIFICLSIAITYFYVLDYWSFKLSDIVKMLLNIATCLLTTIVLVLLSQLLFLDVDKKPRKRK